MESNVFGIPVTLGTRLEKAMEAYNNPNAGDKRDKAVAYVRGKKSKFGNGVSTLSIFYNATGGTITYVTAHSWWGKIYDSYPMRLQNGQWGAFLHTKKVAAASGSNGAVVYRCRVSDTQSCDMLFAWDNPWNKARFDNNSYCMIREAGSKIDWDATYASIGTIGRQDSDTRNGMFMYTVIEDGTSPLFEATLALES